MSPKANQSKTVYLWPQTKWGHGLKAILSWLAAYIVAGRAIDTGSLFWYGLSLFLAFYGIKSFYKVFISKAEHKQVSKDGKKTKT
jgi:hypothetical protein